MTYALLATAAIILIITYIYLKPKQKVTKNIFNALPVELNKDTIQYLLVLENNDY